MDTERVFQALADDTRRAVLDRILAKSGQSLAQLSEGMGMSRQAVAKHVGVLITAELVVTRRVGRERLHYLNPLPFRSVVTPWVKKFERIRLNDLMPEA